MVIAANTYGELCARHTRLTLCPLSVLLLAQQSSGCSAQFVDEKRGPRGLNNSFGEAITKAF